jgi:hypothetical protein
MQENTCAGFAFHDETACLSAGMSTGSTFILLNSMDSSTSLASNTNLPSTFFSTAALP